MNSMTMGLRILSRYLCAFKLPAIKLCLFSVAYACPQHNHAAVHNVDISKPFTHTTPFPSAICPVQLKPGFIREEHTSPACQWPSKVSICPLKLVTTPNCSQVKTLGRTMGTQMSFPGTVSDSLCRNSRVHQLSGCLVSDDPASEEDECGGPGLVSLNRGLRRLMVEKFTLALVGFPAVSMPKLETSVALC